MHSLCTSFCRSSLKIVRSPAASGPPYHGKTPLDYLKRLLESEAWMIAKTCPKRDAESAREILQNWSQGLVASNDAGAGGQGHMSVASAGFGSPAERKEVFRGSERDSLAGRGIAIVSIPGADPELYNSVIRICLEDGMHFAVVWLSDWGDAWFYAWLRSVTDAMLLGCVPVVPTWSDGKIGRAQSAEVVALELQPHISLQRHLAPLQPVLLVSVLLGQQEFRQHLKGGVTRYAAELPRT